MPTSLPTATHNESASLHVTADIHTLTCKKEKKIVQWIFKQDSSYQTFMKRNLKL